MKSESELEMLREEAAFRRAVRRQKAARCQHLAETDPDLTLEDIGRRVGLSRFAVHQALLAAGVRRTKGRQGAPLGLPSR